MADMLSQAEIDALLSGSSIFQTESNTEELLSPEEIDALGEIGNISMGNSATALFTLLGSKVLITTPNVTVITKEQLKKEFDVPCVAIRVEYTQGLLGSNVLIVKEEDVKIITDLMMGRDGRNIEGELTELHLSAISEVMNQMIGSAATSMSSMFNKRIDISPPKAVKIDLNHGMLFDDFEMEERIVKISFRLVVGDLIDSIMMQLLPIKFAKKMVESLLNPEGKKSGSGSDAPAAGTGLYDTMPGMPASSVPDTHYQNQLSKQPDTAIGGYTSYGSTYHPNADARQSNVGSHNQDYYVQQSAYGTGQQGQNYKADKKGSVKVQPAEFQTFQDEVLTFDRKNISLIMDVPLQITVELGRTHKLIREILEFGPGSIVELDKLAGEPVDILVNGKYIAKGEVVVIDETFGVRIIDIADPSKRI